MAVAAEGCPDVAGPDGFHHGPGTGGAVVLADYYLLAYLYTRGTIRSIPPLVDTIVSGLSLVVVPVAIGVAVLRYRLYGIDRLINRTLVYRLLTVLLGLGYYDAARTVEAFSARLRDEVDLDTLTGELLVVADRTVEPTTASLWLRPAAGRDQG